MASKLFPESLCFQLIFFRPKKQQIWPVYQTCVAKRMLMALNRCLCPA